MRIKVIIQSLSTWKAFQIVGHLLTNSLGLQELCKSLLARSSGHSSVFMHRTNFILKDLDIVRIVYSSDKKKYKMVEMFLSFIFKLSILHKYYLTNLQNLFFKNVKIVYIHMLRRKIRLG